MLRIILISLCLILALGLSGCSEEITEPVQTDEIENAPEVPQNLQTLVGDGQVVLSWTVGDASGITQYLVYRGDTTFIEPDLIDSTTSQTFTDTGLRNGLRYFYQVTAIGTNGLESRPSRPVSATPNTYAVLIEGGDAYTNDLDVTVNLAAPTGTRFVLLGNNPEFTGSQWAIFQVSKSWEIPAGDGVKTVYARFRDAEHNETASFFSDDIILDTRASILSVNEDSDGEVLTAGSTILFTVDAGETGGEASVEVGDLGAIDLFDVSADVDGSTEDGVYQSLYTVPGAVDVVDAVVEANFTDAAGNRAPSRNAATFVNIANPPRPVALTAFIQSETEIELSWTRSQAGDFARYLLFRSTSAGVSIEDELVQTIASASTNTHNDSDLEPSETYYYAVFTVDQSGLMGKSNEVAATTFENEAPEAVTLFISDDDSTSVSLGWTQSDADDFESYRIFRSTSSNVDINDDDNLISVITNQTSNNYTDNNVNEGSLYYYVIVVYDDFGERSPASNQVSGPNP